LRNFKKAPAKVIFWRGPSLAIQVSTSRRFFPLRGDFAATKTPAKAGFAAWRAAAGNYDIWLYDLSEHASC
jgi:hypothetical protein